MNQKEWERTSLLPWHEADPAVLYRNRETGKVDWVWAEVWHAASQDRPLSLLKKTTALEAFNLKWLTYEPDSEAEYIEHKANWECR